MDSRLVSVVACPNDPASLWLDRRELGVSPETRQPQSHESPHDFLFSVSARAQLHWPAGRDWHEQRAPSTEFSVLAFSQLHWRADCLPQEQVACWAEVGEEGEGMRVSEVFNQKTVL